jgi:rhamnose transport system ATP-binding protein
MKDVSRTDLIKLMVGRDLSQVFPKGEAARGKLALEVEGLTSRAAGVEDITLEVRQGEILGLSGLVGAGRTELARVLFGIERADAGEIRVLGQRVRINSPTAALAQGIVYLPEDRRRYGVVTEMSVASNITLTVLKQISRAGWLVFSKEHQIARKLSQRLQVKTASLASPVDTLSGGNQQKVVLAKGLAARPTILILDEPTQGIDVGAKAEIHRLMSELASQGLAILMISSELPEILGMSDRIAVMHGGKIVGTLDRADATQERLLELALGHQVTGVST